MPYPTPGFVVKQTFLELEDDDAPADDELGPLPRLGRSFSDTNLTAAVKQTSKFGSEGMRQYWEEYLAQEQRAAEAETPPQTPPAQTPHGAPAQAEQDDLGPTLAGRLRELQDGRETRTGLRLTRREGRLDDRGGGSGDGTPHSKRLSCSTGQETPPSSWHSLPACQEPPHSEAVDFTTRAASASSGHAASSSSAQAAASISSAQPARGSASQCAASSSSAPAAKEERTTVQLTELPAEYTRPLLAEQLDEEGFAGLYNFIYLPMDLRTRTGCSYALVNMRSPRDALRLFEHFSGFTAWKVRSSQVCQTSWSQYCQGLVELIERYRNSPIMHEAIPDIYKPKMFQDQVAVPLPAPTRRLRMPRLRKLGQRGPSAPEASPESPCAATGDGDAASSSSDVWYVDLVASMGMVSGPSHHSASPKATADPRGLAAGGDQKARHRRAQRDRGRRREAAQPQEEEPPQPPQGALTRSATDPLPGAAVQGVGVPGAAAGFAGYAIPWPPAQGGWVWIGSQQVMMPLQCP